MTCTMLHRKIKVEPELEGLSSLLISLLLNCPCRILPNYTPAVSQSSSAKSHTAYLKLSHAALVMLPFECHHPLPNPEGQLHKLHGTTALSQGLLWSPKLF